jgi:hypothetical protein
MTGSDLYACDDYILPELSPFDGPLGEISSGSLSAQVQTPLRSANSPSTSYDSVPVVHLES